MSDRVIEPADAVRAGAEFLDQELPGWNDLIDLGSLCMDDCTHCILGQAYGYYDDGLHNLAISQTEGAKYGFDTELFDDSYLVLEEAWAHEVRVRNNG
jgi:5-formyltetrahydrofolate cyclo-ligase